MADLGNFGFSLETTSKVFRSDLKKRHSSSLALQKVRQSSMNRRWEIRGYCLGNGC